MNIYVIIFCLFFLTAIFVTMQVKLEKKLLESFSKSSKDIISKEPPINEYSIKLIQIGWMPLSGRSTTILFNSAIHCEIHKDFVIFKLTNFDHKIFYRVIYKKDIETKWDIFAGNIIKFKINNLTLICQVYSRVKDFQK